MAKLNKRKVVTILSATYLLGLTALAGFALHRAHILSLPIPDIQAAFSLALPALAGVALETFISFQHSLAAKGKLQYTKTFQAVNAAFLVYETVLATLAGTHIAPIGGRWCPLHDAWSELFRNKDAGSIRRIQDTYNCCGFQSTRDMAWPFPDNSHGVNACVVRYERDIACSEPWVDSERRVAVMLLIVPLGVFLWKMALFLAPGFETPWLPSMVRLPNDDAEAAEGSRLRHAITYGAIEGEADSLRDEVDQLNKDSNLATHIEDGRRGSRVRPSPLIQDQENGWTRD